jgi:undecaprenyl diphosphate synthase
MQSGLNNKNIPEHIALIMDGNRRWATQNKLPKVEGHRRSANNLEAIMDEARNIGVKFLTLWAFSTENWKRKESEVDYLFNLLKNFAKKHTKKLLKEKIRFVHIGRKDRIPDDVKEIISDLEEKTKEFNDYTLIIAVDYGGRDEIIRATKKLVESKIEITEDNFVKFLDTKEIPDPDLVIRTGGELRLSGLMPWQVTYSELYFTNILFPDFKPKDLEDAVKEFSKRKRNFGGN